MKKSIALVLLMVAAMVALPALLKAQSTSTQILPGFLSTATTGSAACPSGSVGACWIAYTTSNPLPTVTVSP